MNSNTKNLNKPSIILIVLSIILSIILVLIANIEAFKLHLEIGKTIGRIIGSLAMPLLVVLFFQIWKKFRNNRSKIKIFFWSILIILLVKLFMLPSIKTPNSNVIQNVKFDTIISSEAQNPIPAKIGTDGYLGCKQRKYLEKLIAHVMVEEFNLFTSQMNKGIKQGICIKFNSNTKVNILDERHNLLIIEKIDNNEKFWVEKDAIEK